MTSENYMTIDCAIERFSEERKSKIDYKETNVCETPDDSGKMYQCSYCSAASSIGAGKDICSDCLTGYYLHVCGTCKDLGRKHPTRCVMCIKNRPHTCAGMCQRGCIKKKPVSCKCTKGKPRYLEVKKEGDNKGRHFWSCRECNFFEWSD